jgi:hypothetical protein
VAFKGEICGALLRWADDPKIAGDAVESLLKKLHGEKKVIPRELVAILVKDKRASIMPILESLWLADAGTWEGYFVELGPLIEATLIRRFPDATSSNRHSIIRMLGKVGGHDSLQLLKAARTGADTGLTVRIDAAEQSIRARLGE